MRRVSDSDEDIPRPIKTWRISDVMEAPSDKVPEEFCHIWQSIKRVKREFYATVDKLISTDHCSKQQAVSTVITVANKMFGRQWKHHKKGSTSIDVNTALSSKSIRETGHAIGAYTLKCIVDEIMASDESVITSRGWLKEERSWIVHGTRCNHKWKI